MLVRSDSFDALHAHRRQPGGDATAAWDPAIGCDFGERRHDESAQVHARVRQCELWRVDHRIVEQQQVEIESARREVEVAAATEGGLDREQRIEQRF